MNILLKDQIDNYRFAVAKIVFLLVEDRYKYIEDIPYSNLMLVRNIETKEKIYISILSKPTDKSFSKKTVHVYYQNASYKRYNSTINNKNAIHYNLKINKLSKSFDTLFNEAIKIAFKDIVILYNIFNRYNNFESKYYNIIEYYFEDAEKKISDDFKIKRLYKYTSKDKVVENRYQVNDGKLSFSPPWAFNDPFDSNCLLSNNEDMGECFRVLCLTHKYNNILMWSYYSQNHQGYCFEYSPINLVHAIKNIPISGICIYGDLNYSSSRPIQKSQVDYFSYTDLKFYINATFTKYCEWSHEDECRFVCISSEYNESFITIQANIERVYEGCQGDCSAIYNSQDEQLEVIQLSKDRQEYRLNG